MLKLYNTLSHKLEEFKPINPDQIGVYSCGPTVYWNQHIGNMYAFVQWDAMVRFLRFLGWNVKWVMNITDVGHMTSDEDSGEDKMEKGAKREGMTPWEIADKYLGQFKESIDLLNIKPDLLPRATEHIQEQIDLIKKIEDRGFAYKTKTGLVFNTAKFPGYADFARLDLSKQEAGSRVEVDPEKKNPWDFLLWVTNQPNHIMLWDSPWGKGFPGWHIECTAMSTKYLGETFDIHTGGKEHIPVHHTNEVAQGFGAFGHQTANFWLHNEWLSIKGEKASKSSGNFYLVTDLVEKGYDPLAFRYLVLTSQYHSGLDFSFEALTGAQTTLFRLRDLVVGWKQTKDETGFSRETIDKTQDYRQKFIDAVSNDLNFPAGLAVVWEMAKSNINSEDKLDLILEFDKVMGLRLAEAGSEKRETSSEVEELAQKREVLRKQKKWETADEVRKEIEKLGYTIEDKADGYVLKHCHSELVYTERSECDSESI
ncbi:cysteine--tRNA ligase [Candidatus Shapirobacteria bacterium CG_4_10_14_0_8_um_filter_39_15]|nr:MAG: cysteine--tRNA ligase [Candidatus Shapirobacteria bacterium CG_4_10_14_0_8_um_filter_39_15]